MRSILGNALGLFNKFSGWIVWNLFLAFIPLVLSVWLFRRNNRSRSKVWWLVFIAYIAFLPNAPYLLTDIIHLIEATRSIYSIWIITLIFIPLHAFAIICGFEAYVLAVLNQGHYLRKQGLGRFVVHCELLTHVLCATGIYLGRFRRFNSWDLITAPGNVLLATIDDLTTKFPLAVILITFIVLTVFYWLMKEITIGLGLRIQDVWPARRR